MKLTGSVGRRGENREKDVEEVQKLLNRTIKHPLPMLRVDGSMGPKTLAMINRFQKEVLKMQRPDELVEPGRKTWLALGRYGRHATTTETSTFRTYFDFSKWLDTKTLMPVSLVPAEMSSTEQKICWGAKVSKDFKAKVVKICKNLGVSPDYLMACMAFESGETFSPSIKNAAGSGAVGLIQFMPDTATMPSMNTSVVALSKMTAVEQLDYVEKYFLPYKGRLETLEDVYMAILYPVSIGKPADHAMFDAESKRKFVRKAYEQNKGFDKDKDGKVTVAEVSSKVRALYEKGLKIGYLG